MARFGQSFAGNSEFEKTSFDPIKPGRYLAQIIDSDVQPNKKGTGAYVKLDIEILDGGAEGRRVFEYVNFDHEKESVASQGQNALKTMARLCQIADLADSTQMHNIPFYCELKVTPASGDFEAGNGVDFRKMQKQLEDGAQSPQQATPGAPPAPSAAGEVPASPAPAAGQGGMPWANG
jgi:hypothetical protein